MARETWVPDLFASPDQRAVSVFTSAQDAQNGTSPIGTLGEDSTFGSLRVGELKNAIAKPADITLALYLDDNKMQDLWLAVTWRK
jgi:hypothetical protein